MTAAVLGKAARLQTEGRFAEALRLTAPLVAILAPSHEALASHSASLKGLGRADEALGYDRQATVRFGARSAVAWHNLAATLGDLGRGGDAVQAAGRAMALGLDAPATWGVLARAHLATGELDKSEIAYAEVMRRAPTDIFSAAEYANLIWMRRGDFAAADAVLNTCFAAGGDPGPLLVTKARLLEASGDQITAANLLSAGVRQLPDELPLLLSAAQAALQAGRLPIAESILSRAATLAPDTRGVLTQQIILHLAAARPEAALASARTAMQRFPEDQSLLGWSATAARAAGDPLYEQLYDYETMIGVYDIATPAGWPSMDAFLADLTQSLDRHHLFQQHPANQSLRHGSQTQHQLTGVDDPAIKAVLAAFDAPIREHMTKLGRGADPLRSRNTGDYRFAGAWSVLLRPGGFHQDHFHSEGWLSSAFYVQTPEAALDADDRSGWIRFGQPPFATKPAMPAERFIRPKPGRLVLFPSYMWHGTQPFTTDERRLTVAFDAIPK